MWIQGRLCFYLKYHNRHLFEITINKKTIIENFEILKPHIKKGKVKFIVIERGNYFSTVGEPFYEINPNFSFKYPEHIERIITL